MQVEARLRRNSLFGFPARESIYPFVSNRALSVHLPGAENEAVVTFYRFNDH